MTKKTAVFLATGFEEIEALTVVDYLRRAELEVDMISITGEKLVEGAHGIPVKADMLFEEMTTEYDLLVLPGGLPGAEHLRDCDALISLLKEYDEKRKYIAAICAAPIILEKAGLTANRRGTSYPGKFKDTFSYSEYVEELVVVDDHIVTSRGPATAVYFALKLIELLAGKEKAEEITSGLLIPFVHKKIKE